MALEHLLAALERDAEAEIARVREAARAEADALVAAAAADSARRRAAALAARTDALQAATNHELAVVHRTAQCTELEARQALIARVFAAACEELPAAVATSAYRRRLPDWLAAARSAVGDGPAQVRCAPSLAAPLRRLVADHPGLRVTSDRAVTTGFVVTRNELTVDATLAARLAQRRGALMIALLGDLENGR